MGHDKLRKFAENETFRCLIQPSAQELLADGYFNLRDHEVKGRWGEFFGSLSAGDAVKNRACGDSSRPIVLELGCGKGEYTVALAERNPGCDYIGVDIKGARLWKGAKHATEHALPNAAFLRTRIEFISAFFAPGEISEIWLTFSDPQFRSENSRLSSPVFLERYRSFLKKGGIVHLKTDSRFLHEYTKAVCEVNGLNILACTTDLYGGDTTKPRAAADSAASQPAVGNDGIAPIVREVQTFYEKMFLEQGYPITYMAFTIDHDGPYAAPDDPDDFDSRAWRDVEGPRLLFGHLSAESRRQESREERK